MVRENIERVLSEYPLAKTKDFEGHPVAVFLRHGFPESLKSLVADAAAYKFEGSAGQGQWTDCPWVATLDTLVTDSVQSGFYPVYLFREDIQGVYLSLNQGMTELRKQYGNRAKSILKARANHLRATIAPIPQRLGMTSIDLAIKSLNERAAFYEAGNICARFYSATALPSEGEVVADYGEMLKLYTALRDNEDRERAISQAEQDEQGRDAGMEERATLKLHKRIERNGSLAKKAKAIHGYNCRACGFNFKQTYGTLGKDFIEAHHLVLLKRLKGQVVRLNPRTDFTVLCSNCHSMIHRSEEPGDIEAFKKAIQP